MRYSRCLLLPVLLGVSPISAQTLYPEWNDLPAVSQEFRQMAVQHNSAAAAKTTTLRQRLIARATYTGSGMPSRTDSSQYVYAGGRGYRPDFTTEHLAYIGYPLRREIAFDTATRYAITGWPVERKVATYTVFNTLDTETVQYYNGAGFRDTARTVLIYDWQHLATGRDQYDWNGAAWVLRITDRYTYNAVNLVQTDTFTQFYNTTNLYRVTEYLRDPGGRLDGRLSRLRYNLADPWTPDQRETYTYDGMERPVSLLVETYVGNSWFPTYKDTLAYDAAGFLYYDAHFTMQGGWQPSSLSRRVPNAQGLTDTVYAYLGSAGGWVLSNTSVYAYNSDDNPVRMLKLPAGPGVPPAKDTFYYEIYNDPAGIRPVSRGAGITVHPNPALHTLYARLPEGFDEGPYTLFITNSAGQRMVMPPVRATGSTIAVPVQDLVPGLYWLQLKGRQGALSVPAAFIRE